MSTTTDLTTLKINYLTQAQYDAAKSGGTINENEIYMTPTGSLIDLFYPVGSYYETSDTTFNPNTAWGGTWVLETSGQVHVSGSTTGTYVVNKANNNSGVGESDGGSAYIQAHTHSFTQPKIPNHSHELHRQQFATATSGSNRWFASGSTVGGSTATDGGGGACTGGAVGAVSGATTGNAGNMPPYIVVIRWHRIA